MKTYRGWRDENRVAHVTVDGKPLNPRFDLANHSPNGFEWGYGGSGPAQLALALIADATANGKRATRWHQSFKFAVVAALPAEWTMTRDDVVNSIAVLAMRDDASAYRKNADKIDGYDRDDLGESPDF